MVMYALHAGRAFPPLRGATRGGLNPSTNSSTPDYVSIRSPYPHSLPAGEGDPCMKRGSRS